jgi:hypothetical protein
VAHKVARRDDLDLAGAHIGLVHHAADAAEMIAVRMGIDHRRDGQPFPDMLLEQIPCRRASRSRGGERQSKMIQPFLPRTNVVWAKSNPRTW